MSTIVNLKLKTEKLDQKNKKKNKNNKNQDDNEPRINNTDEDEDKYRHENSHNNNNNNNNDDNKKNENYHDYIYPNDPNILNNNNNNNNNNIKNKKQRGKAQDKVNININLQDYDDVEKELHRVKCRERVFVKLWHLYSTLDKFFMIVNFSTIIFSIFFTEKSLSLALSIYTLSFSLIFDTKRYVTMLDKLIILYQDEILPEINKCVRKYYKNNDNDNDNNNNSNFTEKDDISDIIYEIQQIEKELQSRYLGHYFTIPKRLRSINWKRIVTGFLFYIVSFILLSIACYFKTIDKI